LSGIFISYRREDSEGQARALSIELAKYVGEESVFLDVDSIAIGRDFRQALHERLATCDAFLALIGPGWLDAKDHAGKRRLDDPGDYLRQEIAVALVRNIPVTPVLVQEAAMPPPERLPDDLKELAFRNGFELSHTRWHSDVRELAHRLGLDATQVAPAEAPAKAAPIRPAPPPPPVSKRWVTRRRALGAAAIAVAAAGLGVAAPSVRRWLFRPPKPSLRAISFDYATVDEKGMRLPAEKAAASVFTEALSSDVGLDMVAIPGGMFLMGSPIYEPQRRPNEGPQRQVTASPFFIGASPITQAQWAAVVARRPDKLSYALQPFPSFFKGDGLPVESVTWNEADEFCRRLSEIAGRDYRLPSEAEWEYACRAETTGPFNVGPTITTELANYCGAGGAVCGDSNGRSIASDVYDGVTYGSGAYDQGPTGKFRGTTTPARTFQPNRFGLYDMHGDVWEYCLDRASANYADSPSDGSANLSGPPDGERVLRGGSWSHNPAISRSAYRDFIAPDNPGWQGRIGLRVVCVF
jgi:formylglycine-generating enzyme required for sulfatase activity